MLRRGRGLRLLRQGVGVLPVVARALGGLLLVQVGTAVFGRRARQVLLRGLVLAAGSASDVRRGIVRHSLPAPVLPETNLLRRRHLDLLVKVLVRASEGVISLYRLRVPVPPVLIGVLGGAPPQLLHRLYAELVAEGLRLYLALGLRLLDHRRRYRVLDDRVLRTQHGLLRRLLLRSERGHRALLAVERVLGRLGSRVYALVPPLLHLGGSHELELLDGVASRGVIVGKLPLVGGRALLGRRLGRLLWHFCRRL